jgi:ABC-type transport system involved in multi-copper enzyme maturation permease subunit
MWEPWGLGPVFDYEWLTVSRRWQLYAARSALVAVILFVLTLMWKEHVDRQHLSGRKATEELGEQFYNGLISVELTFILLAAPAATAGAICVDKARGTLLHVFLTDLADAEIVLGKLAARLVPVLGLIGCSAPVAFLCILMGGIDPEALAGAFLVILGIGIFGCALAFVLSLWATKAHEVLLATYLVWLLVLLAYPLAWALNQLGVLSTSPRALLYVSPYWLAFAPYSNPGEVTGHDYFLYLGGCLLCSAACVLLATWRMRRVVIRQASRATASILKPRRKQRFGPALDKNPLLWLEWHRRRPSRWSRWVWRIYIGLAVMFSVLGVLEKNSVRPRGDLATIVIVVEVVVGFLLLSVYAPAPLAEDRTHATLDVLLTTPASTASILWAKWRAGYRSVLLVSLLPVLTLCGIPFGPGTDRWTGTFLFLGLMLAYGAGITSWGLYVATWTARVGWAVLWSVAAYVFMTIGWIMLIQLFRGPRPHDMWDMGSPFGGTVILTEALETHYPQLHLARALEGAIWWMVVYFVVAGILFLLTWATFDRRLGRMTNRPRPRQQNKVRPAETSTA